MNQHLRTCKFHWSEGEYQHWGGLAFRKPFAAPGTTPKFAPDAVITARHMKLELHLDFQAERVWGKTTHHCIVNAEDVHELRFNAVALEVDRVRVGGKATRFENTGTEIILALPRAARRGTELKVEFAHSVTRPAAGLYFTTPDDAYPERFHTAWSQGQDEDSQYYFPCLDAPNFKQTSEALIYVPSGFFALSNGELKIHRRGRAGGEDLWHYRMELPYSTYLFSVVAGRFTGHKSRSGKVEVRWFVQAGREREGRNAFGATGKILRFFSDFTGHPYPYPQYTQIAVPDFVFGGMENFTVTTQTDLTLHDRRAHLDFSSDDLVAHEAAHSWFGNMVTARSWAHAWLHESFATYMEALYMQKAKGDDEFHFELLRNAEAYFHEDGIYRRPLVTHRYEEPIDLFDAHLYPGGAVRLRHLHCLLGDKAFRAAIYHFLEDHKYGLAETVDLARAVEAAAGRNYDWWFDQWIHCAGFPSLEIKFTWQSAERIAMVTIKQTRRLQTGADDGKSAPFFRLPSHISFQMGQRVQTFPITLEREEDRFLFPLDKKPTMVLFDPEFECPVKRVKFDKPQDMLLHQLRHAPRPIARIEAANTLADKPSLVVTRALVAQLKREPFWGVQQRIARALGRVGGKAARNALLANLELEHPKARREVVAVLGHFKDDPTVARALERKAKQGDPSYYVEAELARALGRCRAPNARALLAAFLELPSHNEVIRSGAFDGLAELADQESLGLLGEGLRYGAPAMSRAAAIRAAGALGRRHQHLRKEVLDLLQPVAEHRDNPAGAFRGKLASLRAVGNLGDLDALPLLRRVAASEADGRIVRLARETAITLRQQANKPAELNSLRSDVDEVTKENKALRERLDKLEQSPARKKPRARAQSRARG
ncbi:MAG: M1 family aminopeptidase [SAR324 cluster bacterium]|nr:M1 family aminopeptidase [SAR324 cluster bacterium]